MLKCLQEESNNLKQYNKCFVQFIYNNVQITDKEYKYREKKKAVEDTERKLTSMKNELKELKEMILKLKAEAEAKMSKDHPEFNKLPNTLDEIEQQITKYRAKANTIFLSNNKVIEEYEERKEKIFWH